MVFWSRHLLEMCSTHREDAIGLWFPRSEGVPHIKAWGYDVSVRGGGTVDIKCEMRLMATGFRVLDCGCLTANLAALILKMN